MSLHLWDKAMLTAGRVATRSPDPSTQNGAVLADDHGMTRVVACNEIRGHREHPQRLERPAKYRYVIHAEQAAVSFSAACGVVTHGLTLVSPWAACDRCAVSILAAGIVRLVTFERGDDMHGSWAESIAIGDEMFAEAGVEIVSIRPPQGFPALRRNGKLAEES